MEEAAEEVAKEGAQAPLVDLEREKFGRLQKFSQGFRPLNLERNLCEARDQPI